jgi:hypothetical protein
MRAINGEADAVRGKLDGPATVLAGAFEERRFAHSDFGLRE